MKFYSFQLKLLEDFVYLATKLYELSNFVESPLYKALSPVEKIKVRVQQLLLNLYLRSVCWRISGFDLYV